MLLAVDIGNTNIVVGFLDKTNIIHSGRISTDRNKTEMDFLIVIEEWVDWIWDLEKYENEGW